jgi:hypothetical protein
MIDQVAATGDADDVAETLDRFRAAGCTTPGVGVVGGYDGYEGPARSLEVLLEAGARV